jgi:hypothetical protein
VAQAIVEARNNGNVPNTRLNFKLDSKSRDVYVDG